MITDSERDMLIALQTADTRSPLYAVRLPLTLISRNNASNLHHFGRAKMAKVHRDAGRFAISRGKLPLSWFCNAYLVVRIVREAPRLLDDDNLAGACKSVRDGIADALMVDDRHPRVRWLTGQTKAKLPSVVVEVYEMRGDE